MRPPLPVEDMAWGMSSSGRGWVRGQLKASRATSQKPPRTAVLHLSSPHLKVILFSQGVQSGHSKADWG